MLDFIKKVEREAYPSTYWAMQNVENMDDLYDYCEGKYKVFLMDKGYLIMTKREVVDLASVGGLSLMDLHSVKKEMKNHFKKRSFTMDCRAKTSYRLLKVLERKGEIKIISEEENYWGEEEFFEINCRFI